MITSRVHSGAFNLDRNTSLSQIKKQGVDYFYNRLSKKYQTPVSNYKVALIRDDGNHVYITDEILTGFNLVEYTPQNTIRKGNYLYKLANDGTVDYAVGEYHDDKFVQYGHLFTKGQVEYLVVNDIPSMLSNLFTNSDFRFLKFGRSNSEEDLKSIFDSLSESDSNYLKNIAEEYNNTNSIAAINKYNTNNFRNIAQAQYTSFLRSMDYTVLRIPSQSMQSFMKMKQTQFIQSDKNVVYVSPIQLFLQGSDFDIDKAYCLSFDFGKNGIYEKWSPLFKYNSYDNLLLSEQLPFPNGKIYEIADEGIDITPYIDVMERLGADSPTSDVAFPILVELLNMLDNESNVTISSSGNKELTQKVLSAINKHNNYINKSKSLSNAFKNALSSDIQRIISSVKNVIFAQSPINMDEPKEVADNRSKRANTTSNPATINQDTVINMQGSQGIGIAAVAGKIFFALTYYNNAAIRGDGDINNILFLKKYPVISNSTVRTLIANVNFSDLSQEQSTKVINLIESMLTGTYFQEEIIRILEQQIGIQSDKSLVISAILSAATDNAKELILGRINASPQFMDYYLYLTIIGYEFSDIAKFMTSPTISMIANLSNSNMFDANGSVKIDVSDIIDSMSEGPNISDFISNDIISKWGSQNEEATWSVTQIKKSIKDAFLGNLPFPTKFNELINSGGANGHRYILEYNRLQNLRKNIDDNLLETFKDIDASTREMSLMGRVLGLNQGIKTNVGDLLSFISAVE